jgi:hypothetical protein
MFHVEHWYFFIFSVPRGTTTKYQLLAYSNSKFAVLNFSMFPDYDVIVVGAGHVGCEALPRLLNMGSKVCWLQ